MNLIKLQDTTLIHGNLLHFYRLTMKNQKDNLVKHSHLPSHGNNNIPRNEPFKEAKDLYSKNHKTLMKETR